MVAAEFAEPERRRQTTASGQTAEAECSTAFDLGASSSSGTSNEAQYTASTRRTPFEHYSTLLGNPEGKRSELYRHNELDKNVFVVCLQLTAKLGSWPSRNIQVAAARILDENSPSHQFLVRRSRYGVLGDHSRDVPVTPRARHSAAMAPYASSSSNQPLPPQLSQGPRELDGVSSPYPRRVWVAG